MKTVVALYIQPDDAAQAVDILKGGGFAAASIQVLRSVRAMWQHLGCTPGKLLLKDFAIGASLGMALYGFFGVIVAMGEATLGFAQADAIAAMLIFMLAGVFVGGMLGAAFGLGTMEEESRQFLSGIRRGGALIVVRTADEHAGRALDLLRQTEAEGVRICWRTSDRRTSHHPPYTTDRLALWVRWVARGVGLALILLVLLFFVGEGLIGGDMPNPLAMSLAEDFLLLTLLMTLMGIVVAWRWEGIGGILIIGSVLLFETVNAISSGSWRVGPLEPFFLLVGLLFLWDWWRTSDSELGPPSATST